LTTTFNPIHNLILPNPWYCLTPIWTGGEEVVKQGLPHTQLAPAWQLLLLGDGSPTRHVQLLTGEPTEVDVIDMSPIGMSADQAPAMMQMLPGPRIRRQVWVRTASGQRYVQGIYYGNSEALETGFQEKGPFWGRHYLFWHHGKPLTLIYEVFSPFLTKYLGPMNLEG